MRAELFGQIFLRRRSSLLREFDWEVEGDYRKFRLALPVSDEHKVNELFLALPRLSLVAR